MSVSKWHAKQALVMVGLIVWALFCQWHGIGFAWMYEVTPTLSQVVYEIWSVVLLVGAALAWLMVPPVEADND